MILRQRFSSTSKLFQFVLAFFATLATWSPCVGQTIIRDFTMSTIAGNGSNAHTGDGGPAAAAALNLPSYFAFDQAGNLYISEASGNTIRMVNPAGIITTIAGGGTAVKFGSNSACAGSVDFVGNGCVATQANLGSPEGLAVDGVGNLYVADYNHGAIRKITNPSSGAGIISYIAMSSGGATASTNGCSALATPQPLPVATKNYYAPRGLAFDTQWNLYFIESQTKCAEVREITNATQGAPNFTPALLYTLTIPNNNCAYNQNPGATVIPAAPNNQASNVGLCRAMNDYADIFGDQLGNLYIEDASGVVAKIANVASLSAGNTATINNVQNALVTLVAGSTANTSATSGDGGKGLGASFNGVSGVAVDPNGNIFISEYKPYSVREVLASSGEILTVLNATGTKGLTGDGGPAVLGHISNAGHLGFDFAGNLYVLDYGNYRIKKLTGTGPLNFGSVAVGSSATATAYLEVAARAGTSISNVALAGATSDYTLGPLSGCTIGSAVVSFEAICTLPVTFTPGAAGARAAGILVTDGSGNINTIGLTGLGLAPLAGFGPSTTSTVATMSGAGVLSVPGGGAAVDLAGNLYVADTGHHVVRKVTPTGTSSVVAGTIGASGYAGDGGSATSAKLNGPMGVAVDAIGNIYIADTGNSVIRLVSLKGSISTFAGTAGASGYSGDGRAATAALLNQPTGLTLNASSNLFVADTGNNAIREVSGNIIITYAGTGTAGFAGDGANAATALLSAPTGLTFGPNGSLYVADTGNSVIRAISPITTIISTVAGSGRSPGFGGDGGPATAGQLKSPSGVVLDAGGDLYIADTGNNMIRLVNANGTISTIGGSNTSAGYAGDGGGGTSAQFSSPNGVAIDGSGNLYVVDQGNNVVRMLALTASGLRFPNASLGVPSALQSIIFSNLGNQPLVVETPSTGVNPSIPAGFAAGNQSGDCGQLSAISLPYNLAAGTSCPLSMAFSSSNVNQISGSVTFNDNSSNAVAPSYATQSVAVLASLGNVITFGALPDVSYGSSPVNLSQYVSVSSGLTVQYAVTGPATIVNGILTITGVGKVSVTGSQPGNASFPIAAQVTQSFAVTPAILTIVANDIGLGLNQALPTYTASIYGFVNGDTQATALSGSPALTTSPATPSAGTAGTYTITASQGSLISNPNYSLVFINGTLTVAPLGQALTFPALPATVTYGSAPLALTATATSGLPITYSVSGPATVSGSQLSIAGSGLVSVKATQPGNSTYPLVSTRQLITVNKATLTVTANSYTSVYGQSTPSYAATIAGLVNSDMASVVSGSPTLSSNPASPVQVGVYPIHASLGSLAALNYNLTLVDGTITINTIPLTLTIGNGSTVYGAALPSFSSYSVTPSGLIAGDTLGGSVSAAISIPPAVVVGSRVGIYQVGAVLQGLNAPDYSVTIVPGALTITPLALSATATAISVPYGTAIGATTIGGSLATPLAQDAGQLSPYFTTTATSVSPLGVYPITGVTLTGTAAANYTVSLSGNAGVTITTAPTITLLSSANSDTSTILTATVATLTSGTPGGSVSFYDGTLLLGTATLNSAGANYTVTFPQSTSHSITAVYAGSAIFQSSTSSPLIETAGSPSFQAVPGVTELGITNGKQGTINIAVSPVGSYAGTVSFSITGLPNLTSANFTPASVTFSGASSASSPVVLIIGTLGAGTFATVGNGSRGGSNRPYNSREKGSVLFALLLLPGLVRFRTRKWSVLPLSILLMACLGMAGCGPNVYSPTGTYLVQITATGTPNQGTGSPATTVKFPIQLTISN